MEKYITSEKLAGAVTLVWKGGKISSQQAIGAMNVNSIFRISSMTKPITSVLAMKLFEEGKLLLQDSIDKWAPEFSQMKVLKHADGSLDEVEPAHRPITIEDLLTHRAGFTYGELHTGPIAAAYRKKLGGDIDTHLKIDEWVSALASLPLVDQPGNNFHYGKSTDLLGLIISRIERKPLGEIMQEKIFAPLGMTDTYFCVPPEKLDRCAGLFGFDGNGKLTTIDQVPGGMAMRERPANMEFESGGQGLWSTIHDYLQFARVFVESGKILKAETVELICSDRLNEQQRNDAHLLGAPLFQNSHGFGLGVAVVINPNGSLSIPCGGSLGSVGWPGAYGGWWRADRVENTIKIFLTHNMVHPDQLVRGIGFGVYEAIDEFAAL